MRMRKPLVILAGLALLLAVGALVRWPQPDRVTFLNYSRIRQGMTVAEVEEILGPAGDYRTGPTALVLAGANGRFNGSLTPAQCWDDLGSLGRTTLSEELSTVGWWQSDEGNALIAFGSDGVHFKDFARTMRYHESTISTLLWRANRQWHRWFP